MLLLLLEKQTKGCRERSASAVARATEEDFEDSQKEVTRRGVM
jgi:hypothetical protein